MDSNITTYMENYFPEHEEKVLFADGFEDAFLGVAEAYGSAPKAAYSISKCLEVLMERDGMSANDRASLACDRNPRHTGSMEKLGKRMVAWAIHVGYL